jgi:gliding motility-associated-like protein
MKKSILILFVIFSIAASGQHDHIWYFGNRAGLDFRSGDPVALTDSNLNTMEGCSAMTDATGLLFYTDGVTVWNRNHAVMENGTGLKGGPSSTQSAIVVPKPGQANHYYIFTVDGVAGTMNDKGLNYSEVDMAANEGLGTVINKNIQLITPTCEKLSATLHANGTDIWIITHQWGTNAFYSYLVTPGGVSAPVISNAGVALNSLNTQHNTGYMRLSPQGNKLVMVNNQFNVQLFNFDNATGAVSNPDTLKTSTDILYGAEFSPTGRFLYVSTSRMILQYDVTAANVAATETVLLNTTIGMRAIKLGPDSKIYFNNNFPITNTVSVINNPDVAGVECNLQEGVIPLSGRRTSGSLPSFMDSPFYLLDITSVADCPGSQITFGINGTLLAESVTWDFGDGSTGTGLSATHTYAASGTYTVRATATRGIYSRFFSKNIIVTIQPLPVANQPGDMILCDESNGGIANFDLSAQTPEILGTQSPANFTVTYHLSQQDADAGSNAITNIFTNTSNPQSIYARVEDNAGGCHATTSFSLIVQPKPVIEMQDEYFVCDENIIVLTAPAGYDAYQWSTGETTRTIFAGPGNYTLTVTKNYGTITCNADKTITITRSAKAVIKEIRINDWTDNNNSLAAVVEGPGDYEYSVDGVNYQASPVFHNLLPGIYTIYVRDRNGCGITEEETVLLMYPRFFTPNGDGHNDVWRIKYSNFEPEITVHVLDRYGKIVNSFTGSNTGWDGTYNGRDLPSTDYWFVVKRKDGREHKGHFSMIR